MRQSGERAARHGHISRAGQAHARGLLIEAAHTAIRTPGPLRAFYARLAARRGKQIALCATARKLAVLAWHLLSKDEDYRYGAPTITQRKLRKLQRQAADTRPADQPRRRDQAQGPRAPLPRGGRAQLPQLRRAQGATAARAPPTGTRLLRPSMRQRRAAGSTVPRGPLFSLGVTRAEWNLAPSP